MSFNNLVQLKGYKIIDPLKEFHLLHSKGKKILIIRLFFFYFNWKRLTITFEINRLEEMK